MLRIATLGIAALATAAPADTIFSFASDVDHTSFTFSGFGQSVGDAQDAAEPLELLIDDANGNGIPLSYEVEFNAEFSIAFAGSVSLGGGLFVHTYILNGEFGFYDGSGSPVLTASIDNGALTALGAQSTWLSNSTLLGADGEGAAVEYVWHLGDNPDYGLYTGASVGPADDGAFTLTFLQSGGGAGVVLGSDMLPGDEWLSEGSYSGSATFVPAPSSAGLVVGASLVLGRRRR
ncbi:MAG: hypothetical protein IT431_09955 [Phycisphaerales bacterium]|nr:hypothetical protein [Phycisphaerales bacterium]